jgi:hypothetical protein
MAQCNVGAPLERMALDIMGPLPQTDKGHKYILVITDYFTKWAEAYPMKDQEASTVADFLVDFICHYGLPLQLHSDQGRQFQSNLFRELCTILGIDQTRTSPYHPQSDGFVERINKTIIDMLSKTISKSQRDWDKKLPLVMLAYRSLIQESTRESPCLTMSGREPLLPVDLLYGKSQDHKVVSEYVQDLLTKLWNVHESVRENLCKASDRQKTYYDLKTNDKTFDPGDGVLLFNPANVKGKSPKLMCKWEGPYTVVRKISDLVYEIKSSSTAKSKVVHVNRLKPYVGRMKRWFVQTSERNTRSQGTNNDQ